MAAELAIAYFPYDIIYSGISFRIQVWERNLKVNYQMARS